MLPDATKISAPLTPASVEAPLAHAAAQASDATTSAAPVTPAGDIATVCPILVGPIETASLVCLDHFGFHIADIAASAAIVFKRCQGRQRTKRRHSDIIHPCANDGLSVGRRVEWNGLFVKRAVLIMSAHSNRVLTAPNAVKRTLEIEVDLRDSGIQYHPGM